MNNDNLDEIYQLIAEIQKDEQEHLKFKKEREKRAKMRQKNKRKKEKRLRQLCFLLLLFNIGYFSNDIIKEIISTVSTTSSSNKNSSDNLFSDEELIADEDEIEKAISNIEQSLGTTLSIENLESYLVLNSVACNEQLSDDEKALAFDLLPIIEDDPSLDKEEAYNNLLNLDIDFLERPESVSSNILGTYSYENDKIKIYIDYTEDELENFEVLRHELIHCLYLNRETTNLPISFKEGMTEILTNEYYAFNPYEELECYPFNILYIKMLCELIGSDNVLQAFSTGNMAIIYEKLAELNGTKEDANRLLNNLDYILDLISQEKSFSNSDMATIISELSYYNITNNSDFNYYLDLMSSLTEPDYYETYYLKLFSQPIIKKAYFSEKLKNGEQNKEFTLTYN